jgi:hypothetical protein
VIRKTGPSPETRHAVWTRAQGRCERCFVELYPPAPYSIHHRKPRQMGGTKSERINEVENLLLLCGSGTTGCHGWVESHRAEAYRDGWLVHSWDDPAEIPIRRRDG